LSALRLPLCALLFLGSAARAQELPLAEERSEPPSLMTADEARPALERCYSWLVSEQNEDGSWASPVIESIWEDNFALETYYAWQLASQGLAVKAMLAAEETPERRIALERGAAFLLDTRLPLRPSDWDVDSVWSMLYGLVGVLALADDPRFAHPDWSERIERRGEEFYELLERHQVPTGGWAYYDDPPYTRRPKWATSFCTALILPAVRQSLERGWGEDEAVYDRALDYLRRCALPNGAYAYDHRPIPRLGGESIDQVKGSLGRIQVCLWALRKAGDPSATDDRLREGLGWFFDLHRFLDVARMRPIPHEAYYANAGYFYLFAHYYAAHVIELLPAEEREAWHAQLRPHLVKVQDRSGRVTDFLGTGYLAVAGTAYAALALEMGMPEPELER